MNNFFVPIETAAIEWRNNQPFSTRFGDIYFSSDDGLQEARHVFVNGNELLSRWQQLANQDNECFIIAETGFGSGLNFLLSWFLWLNHAPKQACLHFISCEKFPLKRDDLSRCLVLWPQLAKQANEFINAYPILTPGFHQLSFAQGRVRLTLMLGDAAYCFNQLLVCGDAQLEHQLRSRAVDAWFLDGFSPAKNEAMWNQDLLKTIALLSKPTTTLATFSAARIVRENLQAVGFIVNKIKGHGHKHEMIKAQFTAATINLKSRTTPWFVNRPIPVKTKKAIILGAGLAGCYTAYALAKCGWQVTLIEAQQEAGRGASGNTQAILYPKLSAYQSPLCSFMLDAFLFAHRFYQQLLIKQPIGQLKGILQLAFNERERLSQLAMQNWLSHYPALGQLMNAEQISEKAGISLLNSGLYIPCAGWIDSPQLCKFLAQTAGIELITDTKIDELVFADQQWHAGQYAAETLVIANGHHASQFEQTKHLPLKSLHGQMTTFMSDELSQHLKIPLCGEGHVLPVYNNGHATGASYNPGIKQAICFAADDKINLARIAKMPASLIWSDKIQGSWAGVRAATPDYLPIVGPAPVAESFNKEFAALAANSRRWLSQAGTYYPGLFLCTGFGSRGLTSIPLGAEWLASLINNEFSFLPRSQVKSLSPARFLIKKIVKA